MIKIDQLLKKDKSLSNVAEDMDSAGDKDEPDPNNDKAVSVSELFGGAESSGESDSAIVNQDMFAERPFSSLMRRTLSMVIFSSISALIRSKS